MQTFQEQRADGLPDVVTELTIGLNEVRGYQQIVDVSLVQTTAAVEQGVVVSVVRESIPSSTLELLGESRLSGVRAGQRTPLEHRELAQLGAAWGSEVESR